MKLRILLMMLVLTACSGDTVRKVVVEAGATSTPVVSAPTLTALPPQAADGWRSLEAGLDYQEVELRSGRMQIARFDLSTFQVRVGYDASAPGRVSEWQQALSSTAIINGGYFDAQGRATALTVFDGVQEGASYDGFGGMAAVDSSGAFSIRSLRDQPYASDEQLAQALQSSPMLVNNGERVAQTNDNGERNRRTVIAVDSAGRLLILVCDRPALSLSELSHWLVDQPLDIVGALNLDGGSSSGFALNTVALEFVVDSLVRVPQVLIVERR